MAMTTAWLRSKLELQFDMLNFKLMATCSLRRNPELVRVSWCTHAHDKRMYGGPCPNLRSQSAKSKQLLSIRMIYTGWVDRVAVLLPYTAKYHKAALASCHVGLISSVSNTYVSSVGTHWINLLITVTFRKMSQCMRPQVHPCCHHQPWCR